MENKFSFVLANQAVWKPKLTNLDPNPIFHNTPKPMVVRPNAAML